MNSNPRDLQWLVFWLSACLPFLILAAPPLSAAPDFPSTEPEFETLRDVEMIDNQPITAMAQDTRGLIWIGTQTGLVRYDGYRFRKFAHKAAEPTSLAGNYVFSLAQTKDGRLWVGTNSDGVSIFDPATERFEHFRHDEKQPTSLGAGTIWGFAGDAQGGMWIATDQGLDYLPAGSRHFVHFRHGADAHSLLDNKVRSLLLDKTGRLWVGSNSGLQRLALDGKSFETIVAGKSVRTLFQAEDGKLWLGTRQHGAAWLMPTMTPAQVNWLPLAQLSHPWIREIVQVKPDQIWLATAGGGIVVLAAGDGQVVKILRHDPMLPGSLALDSLKPMLLDRAGWLWIGTWGGGLQRINTNNTMLRVLRHSQKRPGGLSHPDVRSVLELNNGLLLIGSKGNGIDIFDRQRGLVGAYRPDSGAAQAGALPDGTVYALAQTRDGSVWAGTQQAGVLRQLPDSTAWVAVPGLPDKQVNKLFASRDGSLWAGTNLGVARWRPGQVPADRFEALADERGKPMEASTYALAEDAQGRIWVGSNNGLWLYEPGGKGLIAVPAQPNRPDGLVSDSISGLLFDRRGRLWVATDKGLARLTSWRDKQARFEQVSAWFGADEKNPGENLLEDLQGRIWTGETMIDPDQMRMSRLTAADGVSLNGTWIGAYGQTRDGLLLFGGGNGMMIIDPARFKTHDYAPPLVVTELKINGVTVAPTAISQAPTQAKVGTLTLAPTQHNFALEFAALDYSDPRKNRYQYRLQGYEKDWINTDADHRSAAYGNLWPGRYTLQIRGSNRKGDWSTHELHIPIRVLPAWWQTWWFGLVLLLAIISLVTALVQTRTRYLRRRQRELEQLVDERTGELRQKQSELVDANHGLNAANGELKLSVETLRQLGEIGREITANLDAEIVFLSLHQYVGGLLDAPTMTIYRMNAATSMLEAVFGRDHDQVMPMRSIALDSPTSNAARAVRERRELLQHYELEEEPSDIPGTRQMLTALFAPLIVDDKVLGAMSIQSDKQDAYGERECLIFRTLTAYGAIALSNASAVVALRQAQGQLVQQEKMASLGGLVAGIAHEINTPLGTTLMAISGVEGAWKTLQDAVANDRLSKAVLDSSTSDGMEYTALALKTATRAAELIALFKTISVNADSDRVAEIELADYLPEVATLVYTQLVQNGNKLEIAAPASLRMQVVPDALTETLSRILVNVLNHAFTDGRTGTLRMSAQAGDTDGSEEVIITISDDGHGIAPEDLPKVFDPFFTTKSGMHGHVGLGLHVAYNHVTQRLKGQIKITSALGEGTCVEIRLKNHGNMQKEGE
jgi:ligand-binding sensor domain-containing protein/C4-dicarboxylate-specific signal transduction histidine kinase